MLRLGKLVSFNGTAWTAVVDLRGGVPHMQLSGIPVNRGLASAALVAGRSVCVWFSGDGFNAAEAVLIAVWV